ADGITRYKHDPNQELMAQGLANLASPLVGGMPATGTIARTVTNIRSGARTPVSGNVHAITLLLIILLAAPLAQNIPLPVLAAILMFVAYNMGEWREFPKLKHYSRLYKAIMLTTFLLTVTVDLTVAVEVGLVLAALFFIYRVSLLTEFKPIDLQGQFSSEQVQAYNIYGSLFFAVIGKIEALTLREKPRILILDMHQTISIDTTALESLKELIDDAQRTGKVVIFAGLNEQPLSLFNRTGLARRLNTGEIQPNLAAAVRKATILLQAQINSHHSLKPK
ncbi:MAG: SulP family inorganic anion transporter, partial [Limnobacter sp.]|nr:SulP family inorganic anion transporter [Limnobacter sp.]